MRHAIDESISGYCSTSVGQILFSDCGNLCFEILAIEKIMNKRLKTSVALTSGGCFLGSTICSWLGSPRRSNFVIVLSCVRR